MTSIADNAVKIQTTSESNFSPPSWFGEVVLLSSYLQKHGVLSKINEQVRFARKRVGRYEVIDFLAVLFGYAISGERTLAACRRERSRDLGSRYASAHVIEGTSRGERMEGDHRQNSVGDEAPRRLEACRHARVRPRIRYGSA